MLGPACAPSAETTTAEIDRPRPVVVAAPGVGSPDVADAVDADAVDVGAVDVGAVDVEVADVVVASEFEAETSGPRVYGAPFIVVGDTGRSIAAAWDRYACAPETDESGPEDVYPIDVTGLAILRAKVDDVAGDAVDVDVHLLTAADPAACVRRDNKALAWVVRPGRWVVVVDTFVDGAGVARAGAYRLEVDLVPLDSGPCAANDTPTRMFWSACAPGVDCTDDGTTRSLATPSLGPVVHEAHLVTVDEDFAGDGWPTALRDQIERHYQISQAATGYDMTRDGDWAPEGEGGSHWGGGATGQKLPLLDEGWYVNMYWRDRPARGRRMLVVEPWSGRAVVAAGGWETGPGSNTAIGGACEEIHDHLQSDHRDPLVMGFLADETAPLGPIAGGCPVLAAPSR